MPFYLVRCDLDDSERTTAAFDAALQELGDCVRPMPGTWIVEAATNSEMLKNALLPHLSADDRLLVVHTALEASWQRVDPAAADWMAERFTRRY